MPLTAPDQLRAWRASQALSQSGAAKRLQISVRTLQNWEGGRGLKSPLLALLLSQICRTDRPKVQKGQKFS